MMAEGRLVAGLVKEMEGLKNIHIVISTGSCIELLNYYPETNISLYINYTGI